MKIKPTTTFIISTVFVVAGIIITMATGLWQTESTKEPRLLDIATLETTDDATGEVITQYDPADIRGSYRFGEISDLYGVPLKDLAEAFGLTEVEAAEFQTKSLETLYPDEELEIGTASVRMFVAYYLGLPYTPTEESWLPESAVKVLQTSGQMTDEQAAYIAEHTIEGV